jgi:SnoaL-like domain
MTPSPASIERRQGVRESRPVTGSEASTALVLRYFDMWNTGQGALADELLAPMYIEHTHPSVLGPAASRALVPRLHGLYPGMVVSAEVVLADAEFVVVRTTLVPGEMDGHPDGPGRGMAMFRVVGGKLAEQWSWYGPAAR